MYGIIMASLMLFPGQCAGGVCVAVRAPSVVVHRHVERDVLVAKRAERSVLIARPLVRTIHPALNLLRFRAFPRHRVLIR